MRNRARRPAHGIALALLSAIAFGGMVAGCELLVEFDRDLLETSDSCTSSAECDDANPCTTDVCLVEGVCEHLAVADGPVAVQVPADCLRTECLAGQLVDTFDETDTSDDYNDCTEDVCDATTLAPSWVALPYETPCQEGGGAGYCACVIDGAVGPCAAYDAPVCVIGCTPETAEEVCNDDNPCTNDSCDSGSSICVREDLDGVPAPDQQVGDCQITLCEAGVPSDATDNTDSPDDDNDCTHDDCVDGAPSYLPEAIDSPCDDGGGAYCDGLGACVECNIDVQCGDPATNCRCRQCQAGACVNLTAGTAAPDCQVANDCHALECDGAGSYESVVDNSDEPATDNNPCTDDVCVNGTPSHPNNSDPCDDGVYCNGTDSCSGGSCSVHTGNPCAGPDGDGDCSESCNEANDNCTANDPAGSACDDGLYCTVTSSCNTSGSCAITSGNPCPGPDGDGNCSESCNESNDNCSSNDPNGSICNDGVYCNGSDTCNNGSCSTHAGDPCGPTSDTNCAACSESNDNCAAVEPNGSACDDGAYCNGSDTCNNGSCSVHAGDPCAGSYGDADCSGGCSEGPRNCTSDEPNGSACDDGSYCNGPDSCANGTCVSSGVDPCQALLNTCNSGDAIDHCNEGCDEGNDTCTAPSPAGTLCHYGTTCNDICDAAGHCINS